MRPTTYRQPFFDCSCRQTSNHPSRNDCLMIGLPCCNDLCAILLCLRSHRVGISTDIAKVFLHIQLHPDDRNFTCFYWIEDHLSRFLKSVCSEYCYSRFKVIPFGATSSSFIQNSVLQPRVPLLCHLICSTQVGLSSSQEGTSDDNTTVNNL